MEAKVVYQGNATTAVRGALGQLLAYRHFLYQGLPQPRLLALFAEDVGEAYTAFLEEVGVASVWKAGRDWRGSSTAVAASLALASEGGD